MTSTITTQEDIIRAALYQRVSTSEQLTDRQHESNRARAEREGWRPAEYADEGQSASRYAGKRGGRNREDYGRMLADIAAGQADVVVLWDVSRGDRELESWAKFLTLCRTTGTLIHVTSEDYTYDAGKARDWKTLASAGVDAAADSDKKSADVKSGKHSRAGKGVPQGSIAYGLAREWDPSKPKLNWVRDYPHPETGHVAARIIRAAARGDGWQSICDALNADGIPSPGGRSWKAATIYRIAANPAYARFGVVTEAESLAARRRVSDVQRKGERPARQSYRYSALMRCSLCGGPVRALTVRGTAWYRCGANHGGHGNAVTVAVADAYIDGLAVEFITTRCAELVTSPDGSAAARWTTEAAGHRLRMDEAANLFAAGTIDAAQLATITATLRPRAESAERKAADAAMPSALAGLPDADRDVVAARWDALGTAARKAAVRVIAPSLTLVPGARDVTVDQRIIPWP